MENRFWVTACSSAGWGSQGDAGAFAATTFHAESGEVLSRRGGGRASAGGVPGQREAARTKATPREGCGGGRDEGDGGWCLPVHEVRITRSQSIARPLDVGKAVGGTFGRRANEGSPPLWATLESGRTWFEIPALDPPEAPWFSRSRGGC